MAFVPPRPLPSPESRWPQAEIEASAAGAQHRQSLASVQDLLAVLSVDIESIQGQARGAGELGSASQSRTPTHWTACGRTDPETVSRNVLLWA